MSWRGEICKRCGRRNCIGFRVLDAIWSAVIRDRWNVVCPSCFDEEAEAVQIKYVFIETFAITWSAWD